MTEEDEHSDTPADRTISMAARATIELFGNGAVAKTRERLREVEAEGNAKSAVYWRALLKEVTRLHKRRHEF
jgi:hypothetical protein